MRYNSGRLQSHRDLSYDREEITEIPVPVFRSSRLRLLMLVVCFGVAAILAHAERFKSRTYSLMPPVGWTATTENMAKDGVAFRGPHELGPQAQDFTVNITVSIDPALHETLEQYVDAQHRQLASSKEMKILKGGACLLAGTPAHTILYEVHVANHAEIPVLLAHEVFTMHKDRAYILVLTYPKDIAAASANKYIAAFHKVVASFQWVGEAAPKK
jgi:hypothetical protein